jgi:predicted PurR-regulated permease PerM
VRQERIFFAVLFGFIAILAVIIMQPFLTYIVLAGILTYALFPMYAFFRQRIGKPTVASALSILIVLLLMVLPSFYLVTELVQQVSGAYTSFQVENVQRIEDYLSGITGNRIQFQGLLESSLDQIRNSIVALAPDILGSIGELLLGLFIMFFVMYYGFREGETFIAHVRQILPLEPPLKESLFYEVRTLTQAVLYGQVMTAVIQGTLGAIGLLVFGVSNWLFWGSIMIITAFVPVLGTPLIWAPAAASKILDGDMVRGIGLMIYGATIVMNIDNFLRPKLVSGRTKVHPVLILIGVLGGLKIFGFVGMLVGPLVLAILVAFIKFYEQAYLNHKISIGPAAD